MSSSSGSAEDLVAAALADETLPGPVRQALLSGHRLERITLDADGRWRHEGEPIDNPRIAELFHRSIERTPGGTYLLRVGPFAYPVEVEDAPYFVRRAMISDDPSEPVPVRLWLSDGSEEPLDLASLRYVPGRGFYCRIERRGQAFGARFSRPAYYALADYIEEDGDGYALVLGSRRIAVPESAAPA